jgi:hypothetical protein
MGISEALADQHASSFLASASQDLGDPRTSRIAFTQFANQVAESAANSTALQQAIFAAERALHSQSLSAAAARSAITSGYPTITGLPDAPINLLYAIGRLNVHNLMSAPQGPVTQIRAAQVPSLPDADEIANGLNSIAAGLEPAFVSSLVTQTAEQLISGSSDFAVRVAQAGQDCGQLLAAGEMPEYLVSLLQGTNAQANAHPEQIGNVGQPADDEIKRKGGTEAAVSSFVAPWSSPLSGWITPQGNVHSDLPKNGGSDGDSGDTGSTTICSFGSNSTAESVVLCVLVIVAVVVVVVLLKPAPKKNPDP